MNLAYDCLERNAGRIPGRPAIIDGVRGLTYGYGQLNEHVNAAANALKALGVKRGDRVGLYLRNIPEFIVVFLANCKIGAISVPFNIMLKKMEIEYIVNHSQAKVLVGMAEEMDENVLPFLDQLPSLEKIISLHGVAGGGNHPLVTAYEDFVAGRSTECVAENMDPEEGVSLLYTSGTTGKPKGALATHKAWLSQASMNASAVIPMSDEDLVLTGTPFFHVYFVMAVLPALYAGGAVVTLQRFFPKESMELITRYGVTHFMGTPTMWAYLIEEYFKNRDKYDVSSLWLGQIAGSSLSADLGKQIQEVFGVGLVECYGATESSATVTHNRFGHFFPGSPGWPSPGWEIRIVDDEGKDLPDGEIGELWCKGPGIIKEYWNDPAMTEIKIQNGWWKSGDLAYRKGGGTSDGRLFIVDRKDDMLVCGGYNIYPSEVEGYLAQNPKILNAVVIGVPDKLKGEIPKAFIVLNPGETATTDELMQWAKQNMAAYKAPRQIVFTTMDDLPKTATGKILKRELKRMEIENQKNS